MKKNGRPSVAWLPISALSIDPETQRDVIRARVKHLANPFNPALVGIFTVSVRDGVDGGNFVVDGQHRTLAARDAGYNDLRVPCDLKYGLSRADEAILFLGQNDSRPVSAIDKFRVGLLGGDPDCVGVQAVLNEFGLRVVLGHVDGGIACVDRLLAIYRRDPDLLRETLGIAINAWGTRSATTEQLVVSGLSTVLGRYNGELERPRLVNKLSKYRGGPAGLIGDARALSDIRPINKTRALAEIVVDTYNKGARSGSLPPL